MGVNLTNHVQDLYDENYEMRMKEDVNGEMCSWARKSNVVYVGIKITDIFCSYKQNYPKIYMERQKLKNSFEKVESEKNQSV